MDLGQIFTVNDVASFMTDLFSIGKDARIIDPCFGGGAFLRELKAKGFSNVTGYEIDKEYYEKVADEFSDYTLINNDFLGASLNNYDGIVMNPPYVRHEKINDLETLGVTKKKLAENNIYDELPSTANLYMYFIIKGFDILKPGGEMIVIFPSSWIKARSGKSFQKKILECGGIERQIHISGEVFEKNALVEVVILKLKKGCSLPLVTAENIRYEKGLFNEMDVDFHDKEMDWNEPFEQIATVRRGLTTGFNDMYINPKIENGGAFIKKIISSPKDIVGFSTEGARTDTLFAPIYGEDDEKIHAYVDDWKKNIKDNNGPKTLISKMKVSDEWYRLKLFDCKGIIFSYFVRNDMKFVMHMGDSMIRDNFYIVFPKIDNWLMFGLLNNYYIFYQLECMGKKYGAGLLKLQRYDMENLKFPNLALISEQDKDAIRRIAKELSIDGNREYIGMITQILSKYSDWDYKNISERYFQILKSRQEGI